MARGRVLRGVTLALALTVAGCDGGGGDPADDGASVTAPSDGALADPDVLELADAGEVPDAAPVVDGALPDAAPDCDDLVCEVGFACDPVTVRCVPRAPERGPAGGCTEAGECPDGRCRTDDLTFPGGFCEVDCDACGPGAVCPEGADACLQLCDAERPCRDGWACLTTADGFQVCRPDCRLVGCAVDACNEGTGGCEDCRFPCAAGEACVDGHCVRTDGSCVTSYHCRAGVDRCDRGTCRRAEYGLCGDGCGDLECVAGRCRFPCDEGRTCPADRECVAGVCEWAACVEANVPCAGGTCVAIPEPAPGPAVCVGAGDIPAGEPCDEVSERCAAGALCFGDPDDPLDPDPPDGRGVCRPLCDPDGDDCAPCVRLGDRALGLCLPADCSVLADDCGAGRHCRPYGLTAAEGLCGPAGARDEGCMGDEDCPDHGVCVNRGGGTACLAVCDDDAMCPEGRCFRDGGWAFGLCL